MHLIESFAKIVLALSLSALLLAAAAAIVWVVFGWPPNGT